MNQQSEIRTEVESLESKPKAELRAILQELLYPDGDRRVPEKLNNRFLQDSFNRVEPDERPVERARLAEGYDESWGAQQKKTLATALNYLLTERVGHDNSPIKSQTTEFLAELIVAIGLRDAGKTVTFTHSLPEPPERVCPPDSPFTDALSLADVSETELIKWVEAQADQRPTEHAVYELDCTPAVGEAESHLSKRFRARVHKKTQQGLSLSEKEKVGKAVNENRRIYYVGYASDVPARVLRHLAGVDHGGAHVTDTFTPKSLVNVTYYETEAEAKAAERIRADDLTDSDNSCGYYN